MKVFGLALAVGAALLAFALPAAAATMGVTYSGIITSVGAPGAGTFAPNDTFTFNILVDNGVPDTEPFPGIGDYHGITQWTGSFSGGYSFATTTGSDRVIVYDGAGDGVEFNGHHFAAADIGDYHLQTVWISFDDPTGTMNGSQAFPTSLTNLLTLSASQNMFLHFITTGGDVLSVSGVITSATALATTPIPAALPLLASALGGLGFVGWRRRRIA